jgi:DNA-directed RNA polymerase subunit RPC12/RpoP
MILDYQSFGCFYCDKKFATQNQVENHEKIHTGEKSVALDSSKSLENDLKTFKLPKNHGNQFIQAFQSSVKNKENDDSKEVTNETVTLECKYCGKNFSDRIAFKVHEKIHTVKNLSYSCNFCEKKFGSSQQAKNHEKVHTG